MIKRNMLDAMGIRVYNTNVKSLATLNVDIARNGVVIITEKFGGEWATPDLFEDPVTVEFGKFAARLNAEFSTCYETVYSVRYLNNRKVHTWARKTHLEEVLNVVNKYVDEHIGVLEIMVR